MKWKFANYFASILITIFFLNIQAEAQEHFIYLQTDGQQAFKAEANGKNYTSSSIGYLIIPELKDSMYTVSIDRLGDSITNLHFHIAVNKKDAGYELKNYGAKGWGLFNIQTMNIIMEGKAGHGDTTKPAVKNTAFGDMLSDVVNDSTLNKPAQSDKSTATKTNNTPMAPETNSAVTKVLQENSDAGTHAVFVDLNNPNDTVNIFIPAGDGSVTNSNSANTVQSEINSTTSASPQANPAISTVTDTSTANESKTVGNPFYSPSDNNSNSSNTMSVNHQTNPNCKDMATEDDLNKLRKKIKGETDSDIMIVVAKKQLKGKCVTTSQVKNVGAMFLSDEGRYNFYEAMYNFTYDSGNYITLQSQLIDPYYKKRFQTLLH